MPPLVQLVTEMHLARGCSRMIRRAVIVGVNKYKHADINDLQFAVQDAAEMHGFLSSLPPADRFEQINFLPEPADDEVLQALEKARRGLGRGDLLFFYFSGHGVQQQNGPLLLLCPSAIPDVLSEGTNGAIPHTFLDRIARTSDFDCLFIFDACRNAFLRSKGASDSLMRSSSILRDIGSGQRACHDSVCVKLWSCNDGEQAQEVPDLKAGIFTVALVETLREALRQGRVAVNEALMRGVTERMRRLTGGALEQRPAHNAVPAGAELVLCGGETAAVAVGGPPPPIRPFSPESGRLTPIVEPAPVVPLVRGRFWKSRTFKVVVLVLLVLAVIAGAAAGFLRLRQKDGETPTHLMVEIPGGAFTAGMELADVPESLRDYAGVEKLTQGGRRRAYVPAFKIDKYEVTNEEYAAFVKATAWPPPTHWGGPVPPPELARHPVVNVTYRDAEAYARWAGKRLPTSDEWEKSARGVDARVYPWGNTFLQGCCNSDESGLEGTSPVDGFPNDRSPYGVVGMGGNVAEWTSSFELNEDGNQSRVVCGGSWYEAGEIVAIASFRRFAVGEDVSRDDLGFRCAR